MPRHDLAVLFDETVSLYLQLSAWAAFIYRKGAISGPRRTVLIALARSGPQTVAEMARTRSQSRQRLQPLVNRLVREGLLQFAPNPAHRRSPLVTLTASGRRSIQRMLAIEDRLRAELRLGVPASRVTAAAAVLAEVRGALARQDRDLREAARRTLHRRQPRRSRR